MRKDDATVGFEEIELVLGVVDGTLTLLAMSGRWAILRGRFFAAEGWQVNQLFERISFG